MTRAMSSCRQSLDRRLTGVLLLLLFSVVSVDAAYKGVGTRKNGMSFHCEVRVNQDVKFWMGTYRTEALAALACDVVFFYTNRPSEEFNFEYSEDVISRICKPRSAYDSLNGWQERRRFIKAEANALVNLMSSQDDAQDFHWEDVAVPPLVGPLVPVRQRSGDVARTIVEHFHNQAEQLREFMAWLMHLSNVATQSAHKRHFQMLFQQWREETVSQSHIEEALFVGGDQLLDATSIMLLLDSIEARSGGVVWLTLIASSLTLLFKMFAKNNACDIEDASINANEASVPEQDKCQREVELGTKRLKINQPSNSIELDPEQEDLFTVTDLDITYDVHQYTGYDMRSKKWRKLPPFSFLPDLDPGFLSPQYSICGHDSLMCVNISTVGAELVVFNPLTGKRRLLPPLLFPRHPVLLHMIVDSTSKSYQVIVAGNSSAGDWDLSKKMEIFDSKTSKWEEMYDLPGPGYGLNEYQAGVCANGILYFIAILTDDGCRGVVAFDVENKKWLPNMTCVLPNFYPNSMLQLLENNGELYLFYEQKGKPYNMHHIDMLVISNSSCGGRMSYHWKNVVTVSCRRRFNRYPEYICVGCEERKLCIFDTIERWSMVYDVQSGKVCEVLDSLQNQRSIFHSLNPIHPFLH